MAKQTFLRLHEIAHGFMPWQKDLYAVIEECDQTLDPETADLFDREANAFASEVLFQIDTFTEEAESVPFGILAPVRLHKKYGASIYSAVRQYVSKNHRACVVLVLNPPELVKGGGFTSALRRVVASPRFVEAFGNIDWPNHFTPSDTIGSMIPLGKRRMSGKRSIFLTDKHKSAQPCAAEAFTQTHQVFILIHAVGISSSPIILP